MDWTGTETKTKTNEAMTELDSVYFNNPKTSPCGVRSFSLPLLLCYYSCIGSGIAGRPVNFLPNSLISIFLPVLLDAIQFQYPCFPPFSFLFLCVFPHNFSMCGVGLLAGITALMLFLVIIEVGMQQYTYPALTRYSLSADINKRILIRRNTRILDL
ncbi:hypothetical protein BDW66DRAFT_12068 [Aspergillus desertorum]